MHADGSAPSCSEPRGVATDLIEAAERNPVRVVIAGGGVAALEAALALRAISATHFEIHLVAPDEEFHARPLSVAEPFDAVARKPLSLRAFASDNSVHFHRGALVAVHPLQRTVAIDDGDSLGYDALLIAIGATARPALAGALTFRGSQDGPAFRQLLAEIDAGEVGSVAFVVPPRARWTLPLYELALMTAARAGAHHVPLRIDFLTTEDEPLALFGPRVSKRVRGLMTDAGIRLRTRVAPIVAQRGRVFLAHGGVVAADRTVAVARLAVPAVPGIPQVAGGFIPTDLAGRVEGMRHVYAAGDATWYPIKQGGVASQHADVVASAIAADSGLPVPVREFEPVLRGILLTGEKPELLGPGPSWHHTGKIAGHYLAPYLAGHAPEDTVGDEHEAALDLALEAADAAAGWQDPQDALRWLDVAEGLNVALPLEYADKRREWTRLTREAAR